MLYMISVDIPQICRFIIMINLVKFSLTCGFSVLDDFILYLRLQFPIKASFISRNAFRNKRYEATSF